MSKIVLLIVVASLLFLALKGESVRQYFGIAEPEASVMERKVEKPADTTTGAAPSPGNDPNMHNSPTRRLGF